MNGKHILEFKFLFYFFLLQYVVVTVCLKAGLETTAWTKVSITIKSIEGISNSFFYLKLNCNFIQKNLHQFIFRIHT